MEWSGALRKAALRDFDEAKGRVLAELALVMPGVTLLPYAVTPKRFPETAWWLHVATTRVLLSEYLKYLPAVARLTAQRVIDWGDGQSVAIMPQKRADG